MLDKPQDLHSPPGSDLAPSPALDEKASSKDPGDYLVVERRPGRDPIFHLPVKTGGKPNHRLMGGAWAALHEGYRGRKYEGPDKAAALKKLTALYHSEKMPLPGSAKELELSEEQFKQLDPEAQALWLKCYGEPVPVQIVSEPPATPISFAELEATRAAQKAAWDMESLSYDFRMLSNSILDSQDPGLNKAAALNQLVQDFATRAAQLPKAKSLLTQATDAIKGLFKPAPEPPAPEPSTPGIRDGFAIYKEGGSLRWLGVFSNKYRDRDNPPEIIATAAHIEFAEAVQKGLYPHPELRLWHLPGAVIGQAEVVAWDDAGFQVAAGTIRKGMEPVAEMMQAVPFRWAMSHGMPVGEVRREDASDPTIITRYRSKEITALPEWAAANELTTYLLPAEALTKDSPEGGVPMAFDEKSRQKLEAMFGKDQVEKVEQLLQSEAAAAEAKKLDSKALEPAAPAAPPEPPAPVAPAAPEPPAPMPDMSALQELNSNLVKALEKTNARLDELTTRMEALKGEITASTIKELASTPAASQASLVELMGVSVSRGHPAEARLKGRAPADLTGPQETKDTTGEAASLSGVERIPFLRTLLGGAAAPAEAPAQEA